MTPTSLSWAFVLGVCVLGFCSSDFVRNFEVMVDLNNGLIRIRNQDRKYVKKPIKRIITDENNVPIFLDRKVKLQPGQAVAAVFRLRNLNSLMMELRI